MPIQETALTRDYGFHANSHNPRETTLFHFRFYENESKHSNSRKNSGTAGRRKLSKLSIVQHTIGDSHRCIILPSMQYYWHGHYCNTSMVRCIVTPLQKIHLSHLYKNEEKLFSSRRSFFCLFCNSRFI